jgi:serine/threonine-protein kinase
MTAADSGIGATFGKYQIIDLLHSGGLGDEVYKAYDTERRRTVALKIHTAQIAEDGSDLTRFQREAYAAARLQEPHVIPIHEWGEIDGKPYIDMRFVDGANLNDLLSEAPLDPSRAVAIMTQIAAALDAVHAEGIVHRDVKPSSIVVTAAGFAYLVNFTIASTKGDTRLEAPGTVVGTFPYMAPERFTGSDVTPAVDVYGLACALYECLTGATPYQGVGLEHQIAGHLTLDPPRPSEHRPDVPAEFDEVIARGMAKKPEDRYQTASELAAAACRALTDAAG